MTETKEIVPAGTIRVVLHNLDINNDEDKKIYEKIRYYLLERHENRRII